MIRNLLLLFIIVVSLASCGQTGPLYLTKDYTAQHQTVEQVDPPSDSLLPIENNQRVLRNS